MSSFGEKLKRERERRNTTIEQIASTTKIRRGYLEALERNKFDGLPGGAFGKLYIRAYAEVLGFDPQPLIAEYDRERFRRNRPDPAKSRQLETPQAVRPRRRPRAWLQNQADLPDETPRRAKPQERPESPQQTSEIQPQQAQPLARRADRLPTAPPPQRLRTLALLALGSLAAGAWIYFAYFGNGGKETDATIAPERPAVLDPAPLESSHPASPLPESLEAPVETAATGPPPTPSHLSVAGLGLGRRVVDRRLEGRAERFEEGVVAWFSTRVLGGKPGDSIRHVWLREGQAVESIRLELGGPHWRTHSHKRLWGIGQWRVEVRDPENLVLATATFDCVPAGSI